MNNTTRYSIFWFFAWLTIIAVSMWVRPLMPIDETRYAAVAWNMWLTHDFLVPHFLGHPYAQKPPLLFWLIDLGWYVFGVNDVWARLVPALFALGNIFLTFALARQLWPEQPTINKLAPGLLIANLFWLFCTPLLNFDMMTTFFILTMINALVSASRGGKFAWVLFAVSLGLGILSKGPVVLIYVLIPALTVPWWTQNRPSRWWPWYGKLTLALLVGIAIALSWAIPAAIAGGSEYANKIFLRQSAGRLVDSFAHSKPIWWYLPMLPIILLPWLVWPNTWRACSKSNKSDRSLRFIHLSLWPTFIIFCLISQKALRYLLPLLPIASVFLAYGLSRLEKSWTWQRWPVAIFLALVGICVALIPVTAHMWQNPPPWLKELSPIWGYLLILLGIIWLTSFSEYVERQTNALVIVSVILNLIFLIGVARVAAPIAYDVRPLAKELHQMQTDDLPIVYVGKYYGQYQFYGRLTKPLTHISSNHRERWAKAHPNGWLLDRSQSYYDTPYNIEPNQQYYFRDHRILLWSSKRFLENVNAKKSS